MRARSWPGIAFAGVGVVLVVASFAGPWWVVSQEYRLFATYRFSETAGFRLLDASAVTRTPTANATPSTDYGDSPATRFVLHTSALLLTYGSMLGLGLLAEAATARDGKDRRTGAIFAFLAAGLSASAVAVVSIWLPNAVTADGGVLGVSGVSAFWDNELLQGFHTGGILAAGAGWGWYAALASAISFLSGGFAMVRSGTELRAARSPQPSAKGVQ